MLTQELQNILKLGQGGSYSASRDAIKHQIWDTRVFETTVSDFSFFSQPLGSQWRIGVKSTNETNLEANGKLPNGQTMLFTRLGIGLIIPKVIATTDGAQNAQSFINIMQSSVFDIKVAGREFDFQVHGRQFLPSPIAMAGDSAATIGTTRFGDMIASGYIKLTPAPIFIDQLVSFSVNHKLSNPDTNVTTILNADASALKAVNATMQVTLEGYLTRAK